jgi:3-oxoacyl-[acyl-carrier protein] reductase
MAVETGRVALVTGASSGIGEAAAHELLAAGFTVYGTSRKAVAGEERGGVEFLPLDVTDDQSVADAVREVLDRSGRIDVLVNNAGLGGTAMLAEMTDDQWSSVVDVTLNGTMRMTRAALQHMQPRGTGVIVNNASVVGWRAQEGQSHYAAAKAGVMALTRCAALEAAHHGVRINAVAPSLAMHKFLAKVTTDELLEELTTREAFGRAAEPWEVANVIVFLASDYSTYMTGEVVSVSSQHP